MPRLVRPSGPRPPTPLLDPALIPSPYAAPTIDTPNISRAYRDCKAFQWFTLFAVATFEGNKKRRIGRSVLSIPGGMCVKYGYHTQLTEATALRFVAKNTNIPVPKIYCAFQRDHITYILMDQIDGEEIGKGWAERPREEKEDLLRQLKDIFKQLREIPHPRPGTIAASDMKSLWDPGLFKGDLGFGPFANEKDFNDFLRFGLQRDYEILDPDTWIDSEERDEISKMVDLQDTLEHKICFTHGDANCANILVKKGKIVGLIDFEFAGFYPEYWEYTNALNIGPAAEFWKEEVRKFLDPYPRELEMENIRRKHFGPRGYQGWCMWY